MRLRQIWDQGGETIGGWLMVPSSVSAEVTARAGFDYVCLDLQHGLIEPVDAVPMVQAILAAGGVPIARAPWNESATVQRLLDVGAHAVIAPMINSVADAQRLSAACRYPPQGERSWGPTLGRGRHTDPRRFANDGVAAIAMIETAAALDVVEEIAAVDGIDALYVGPADLSLALGLAPGGNDGTGEFDDALAAVVAACERHGKVPGIHATGALAPRRRTQGFRMITIAVDVVAMQAGFDAEREAAQRPDHP